MHLTGQLAILDAVLQLVHFSSCFLCSIAFGIQGTSLEQEQEKVPDCFAEIYERHVERVVEV